MAPPLADTTDVDRFGYDTTVVTSELLDRASTRVRAYTRQQITDDASTVTLHGFPPYPLPERPVSGVSSVTRGDGTAVDDYTVVGSVLYLHDTRTMPVPWRLGPDCEPLTINVDYQHGYTTVPDELVELTCAIAARFAGGAAGAGQIKQETVESYCLDPDTRVLCGDLAWRPVGGLVVGDDLVGFDEQPVALEKQKRRKLRPTTVTSTGRLTLPSYRVWLSDERSVIASADHRWLAQNQVDTHWVRWERTEHLCSGSWIRDMGSPWETDTSWEAGYLSGVFDGEASISQTYARHRGFRLSFAQKDGVVLETTRRLLKELDYEASDIYGQSPAGKGVYHFHMSGMHNVLRFLGSCRPVRLLEKSPYHWPGRALRTGAIRVEAVEFVGDREVVAIGTGTRTLFAEGLASHNSVTYTAEAVGGAGGLLPGEKSVLDRFFPQRSRASTVRLP